MSDWLLLRLSSGDDAAVSWAAVDASGQLLSAPSTDTGADLHTLSAGRRVALLVPGADVSRFQIPLPAGNESRLRELAPFAIEDQLSEDVERLHFAVGGRDPATGLVGVAVTDRERMRQWLEAASRLQLIPAAVYAEADLAPALPGHVTMLVDADQLVLRRDAGPPVLLPASDPRLALEVLLGPEADLATVNLAVYSGPEDWPRHAASIEALRSAVASFKVQLVNGAPLALLAAGLAQSSPINLLQGEYRPHQPAAAAWRAWRGAALLAGALLALHLAGSWWQLHQLRAARAAADQQIARRYGSIFPGQSPGANPRRAMEQRLAALAGESGRQGELLTMLAAVAAARDNVPGTEFESLAFKSGSMQLTLSAPDAETLARFSEALRAGGYRADITSGNQRDGRYAGKIELEAQGS